jgi:HSP20 family protein
MSLTLFRKRNPLSIVPANGEFARLRDEMDRTLERFYNEPFGMLGAEPKALRTTGWIPPLDVSENETEVTIRAEVPGIPTKDLDISITGNVLTMSGKKEEMTEKKEDDFYQCERRFGSFRRVIELPETIDAEKVTAEADNGVVTIHVAKKPGVKPKHVEVKPAANVGKKVPIAG